MTTKFASRRLTTEPLMNVNEHMLSNPIVQHAQDIQGIYERHGSARKTPMQMFSEHQQLSCARLSVPHERRQRGRFSGTQNSFLFQTATETAPNRNMTVLESSTPRVQQRMAAFDMNRQTSVDSQNSGKGFVGPRIKSSLMGTTARQKLLKYKLAAA